LCLHVRRDLLYTRDAVSTSSPPPFHQVRELQEILDAAIGAACAERYEGLLFRVVGPLRRHGEEPPFVIAAVKPVLAPAPTSIESFEVTTTQRMERMGDPKPSA
jgi:hypothetical protein